MSHQFQFVTVGKLSPYWIVARLSGAPLPHPVLVACVYIPNGTKHSSVMQHFEQQINQVHVLYPNDPITLLGDFNKDLHKMQLWFSTWPIQMQVLVNGGNVPTGRSRRSRQGRTVDHIVTHGVSIPVTPPWVLDSWDMSDHYPLVVTLPVGYRQVRNHVPATGVADPITKTWIREL